MLHLTGDVVGLVNALGEDRFAVVGHDRGSPVASSPGLFRPDLVRGVALLSRPYLPRGEVDQLTALTALIGPNNYQVFFQEVGVAEALFEPDVRAAMVNNLVGASGDAPEVKTLRTSAAAPSSTRSPTPRCPHGWTRRTSTSALRNTSGQATGAA